MNYIEFFKRLIALIKLCGYSAAIYFAYLGFSTGKNLTDSLISSVIFGFGIAGVVKAFTWLLEGFFKDEEKISTKKEFIRFSSNFYAVVYFFCLAATLFGGYEVWKTYGEYGMDTPKILGGLLAVFFFMYCADYAYRKWTSK
jgi:magnesium-transporting ATPase (P-type)